MKELTVILSVYNGEEYLNDSIQSVIEQSFKDFEFIIIDDCSNDKSLKIIESYEDSRLKIIKNPENIGLTKSLNLALNQLSSKYISRIDHDDIASSNRFVSQIEFLNTHPDVFLVSSNVNYIDDSGNVISSYNRIRTSEDIYFYLHFINVIMHPTVMFRNIHIQFDESFTYAQDFELWNRLKYKYKFFNIPKPLLLYRKSEKQISNASIIKQKEFAKQVFLSNMNKLMINDSQISSALYFHDHAFQDNYKKLSLQKLYLLLLINHRIIKKTPAFLTKRAVRLASYKMFAYYLTVYLRKFKIFNPIIDFVKKIV